MDILEIAVGIELEGMRNYRKISEESDDKGLRKIFSILADAEGRHKDIFEKMKSDFSDLNLDEKIIEDARDIFKSMARDPESVSMENYEVEIYRRALEAENYSIEYYKELTSSIDEKCLPLLNLIIEEEKKHYRIIEEIIRFVNRPQEWLENAEWNNMEGY